MIAGFLSLLQVMPGNYIVNQLVIVMLEECRIEYSDRINVLF